MQAPIIFWYRQDLRTYDLPALAAAAATGKPLVACYILDDVTPGDDAIGGASRWWLHHSLQSLAGEIKSDGGQLVLRRGETQAVLQALVDETGADQVHCSRQYEPWACELENRLHQALQERDIRFKRYGGSLLFEPGTVMTQGDTPFKVFTPFWRNCRAATPPATPGEPLRELNWHGNTTAGDALEDWYLCPTQPDWAAHWPKLWRPGTEGARQQLTRFLADRIHDYSEGRNHPARQSTSRLSPHMHFGEISPREVWHAAQGLAGRHGATGGPAAGDHGAGGPALADQVDKFLSELGWREFSYHLLYHFPTMSRQAFKPQFDHFPWLGNADVLAAWQRGQTGYPIVDAGMRELWHTGYMHNRIRMVVASFLTKHLLIHWRAGARWFHDTLLDADLASNSCGWQWVAGSGADASPYFRIFNPIAQGEKFDKQGHYVRHWVPELAELPDRYLHRPWEAPADLLAASGIVLGESYPLPIVDHKQAREAALSAYGSLRGQ